MRCKKKTYLITLNTLTFVISILFHNVSFTRGQANTNEDTTNTSIVNQVQSYNYQCLQMPSSETQNFYLRQKYIGLQVTSRPTHQIITRIFSIFLTEILKYNNVVLIPIDFSPIKPLEYDEVAKVWHTLKLIEQNLGRTNTYMINLAVWMSSLGHIIPDNVEATGPSMLPGRFGWFIPEEQISISSNLQSLNFEVFLNASNKYYNMYVIDNKTLDMLQNSHGVKKYTSSRCAAINCATLLAENYSDSAFVEQQIEETQSFLNILWLGSEFRAKLDILYDIYRKQKKGKCFVVLHWSPSDVIDVTVKFVQMIMPRCEEYKSLFSSTCKYELTPILKYYSKNLDNDRQLKYALNKFYIEKDSLHRIHIDLKNRAKIGAYGNSTDDIYNEIACKWLNENPEIYSKWISKEPKKILSIGGIFPINVTSYGHYNITQAVQLAVSVINSNSSILEDYDLQVLKNDGQCKADMVMKAFIHYFDEPKMLGVLGPACSETVEPIAGISRHMSMPVISYSAEGASFADRTAYPYFFRTIGSNRQYEDVYISLMKKLRWRRVAALTEDGQKYTEYISHMEATLKKYNLEMIINKKFLEEATSTEINKHLLDLKMRHAKIIIADIHIRSVAIALCEAYKLKMTAVEGYVWFLPSWLSKDWAVWAAITNNSCSQRQLKEALEGHLSIMHAPFGKFNSIMQEGKTIREWLKSYTADNERLSNYIGFAYDGVWTFALAADQLLKENKNAFNYLRSKEVVKRLKHFIWKTDFQGLSGRVRFGVGGSRITSLIILQWRASQFIEVGRFDPTILGKGENLHPVGGNLSLNMKSLKWLFGTQPGDGRFDCNFANLAEFLDIDCHQAATIFTLSMCFLTVVLVSFVSFFFWKRRYDNKLKHSAKIMKNFGIDLLSPSRNNANTLDKWEIPKENVVVNRRLGEGAFGTVYGGEAKIGCDDWTAVAVKTLKSGASTEDRLDFLSEAEAMKRFDHKNIVKLLAVCLQSEPIYTIMEFMLYGDLKTYLLARRNMVSEKASDESDISPKRLTMYAMDVARGLAYLALQKYVHRDLACRNCLVNSQRIVKIGDFGMARPTFESDYYRFNRKGMLPVRWMAPESLALGMFTPASDIWAFGVVIYEIITFGSYPYQGLTNNQVLEYVKSGNTLEIPPGVKPQLEGLIKACWSEVASKRPTATEVIDYILNYPRLLIPCLDFPGAAVEMPETESDQLELLPKLRKCSPLKRNSTLDIQASEKSSDNYDPYDLMCEIRLSNSESGDKKPNEAANCIDIFSPITPDGYSIMSPLLMHQVSDNSISSQGLLLKKSHSETLQQTPF